MTSSWWDRESHSDRRPALLARGWMKAALRAHFLEAGFTEVECGILQASPGNEAYLHAFATERIGTDGARQALYLHTSPEFAAKKLLAAGEEKIFEFARVFRNREAGPLHACEFTMLEWYRADAPYKDIINDTLAVVAIAARTAGHGMLRYRDRMADPHMAAEHLTVAEAFRNYVGIDLLGTVEPDGTPVTYLLKEQAEKAGVATADDDTWSDIFSRVLTERVEPRLGNGHVTILDEYPRAEAALARACAHDPRVAERFEVYACGVELANGFGELTDAKEQRARFEAEMDMKEARYGERYPLDEDFLACLAQMPPASGVALGFDRLVMLATGAPSIAHVQWTPAP
jgi:lysyl-tRNA synthetase class 2